MTKTTLRVAPTRASRGERIPAKLSWAETAREMAASGEDWSEWDATLADGLDAIPWDGPVPGRVAEIARRHSGGSKSKSRSERRSQRKHR